MKLSPARFNRFLAKMGQAVTWARAIDCPCRNRHSGAATPNCPACSGRGQVWDSPIECLVALTGQQVQREWEKTTQFESGDVVVTLPSDSAAYAMGEFDRVIFTDSSQPFSVPLVSGREPDLDYADPVVDRAVVLAGGELVEIEPPIIEADGSVAWPAGNMPMAGTQYSISGRRAPEYFCYHQFPQDRAHHGGRDLPRRVVLRKFDLLGRR